MWEVVPAISNSNHMPERAIWDKLPECIFENFEIARVKREQFPIFQKSRRWIIPKIAGNKHMVNKQTLITPKKTTRLKLISFNTGQLQISKQVIDEQQAI